MAAKGRAQRKTNIVAEHHMGKVNHWWREAKRGWLIASTCCALSLLLRKSNGGERRRPVF